MPNLVVIAGPNGAGKTTTALALLREERRVDEFVNADIIAADEGLDDVAAGRKMLRRIDELVRLRKSVAFETTAASLGLRSKIHGIQESGYLYHLVYIWIPSADMAVQRVAARVRSGGHDIPEGVIRRRYGRSLDNFFNDYMPMADAWIMIDNSNEEDTRAIAERSAGGSLRIYNGDLWTDLQKRHMKPTDTAREPRHEAQNGFTNQEILAAARHGARAAIRRHKALGQSIVVWRDGRVVVLEPEEIAV